MPVLDGSFEAFVTNLGKYNEGELVGEWVQFPSPPPDGHYTNTYFFKGGFAVRVWL